MSESQPTVGALMRAPATTVEPDSHVASAAYLMKRSHDSALVVTDDLDGHLPIAVITDADVSQAVADGRDLNETRINQLGLGRLAVVRPGTSVAEAAEQMLELSIQHLPVVDDGRLVGLVDMPDVCRALLNQDRMA
ncbi:MAG: putative signal-transduction protein with domain [Blastococcus sp.]|nr:putative signal-transduction protein with domain [Blastococcus sp.]